MKLWTIQHIEAWKRAQSLGYLTGNPEYAILGFEDSYAWMMGQMKLKLAQYKQEHPVWLWTARPTLRIGSKLKRGHPGILLKVELEPDEILISDFMAWHVVLNDQFLAFTEAEDEQYDSGKSRITKEQSWTRIFEYEKLRQFEYWEGTDLLQAVTGRIEVSRIKIIREFIAK
ncbi:DUF3841 domain-containing protein [Cohnella sp. GCM10020058]|uniref:DUF3841 domain-containing protein n=1 Tax=Cohnella sp. GCM10020058 TaxID=3317330 RepID=UPI00362F91F5